MSMLQTTKEAGLTDGIEKKTDGSGLRARLRSDSLPRGRLGPPPPRSSRLAHEGIQLVSTSHFFAALDSVVDTQDDQTIRRLKFASVKASTQLHTSILADLQYTRDQFETTIGHSSKSSSSLLARTQALYSNIEHPLSATLCHSAVTPRATVSGHCTNLHNELLSKVETLNRLESELIDCMQLEEEVWKHLEASNPSEPNDGHVGNLSPELQVFQSEVENIVEMAEQQIDDIEAEFCDAIKAETVKMISMMM